MTTPRFNQLFRKVLNNTATTADKEEMRELWKEYDEAALLPYNDWQDTTGETPLSKPLLEKTMQYILSAHVSAIKPAHKAGTALRWLAGAAAAVLILLASYLIYYNNTTTESNLQTIATTWGEHKTISLEDGSTVHINGGSKLQLPEHFNSLQRTVRLEGEAFFEVSPDNNRPFIVQTGNMVTTVLGTSFNIATQGKANGVNVSVKTGKVRVVAQKNKETHLHEAILLPGMHASYQQQQHQLTVTTADTGNIGGWQRHLLVFNNVSLEEICLALERQYGVQFIASDPGVLSCRFSTRFDSLNLQAAIDKLSMLGDLHFLQQGKLITIKGKACSP